jgi:hypothetical protein
MALNLDLHRRNGCSRDVRSDIAEFFFSPCSCISRVLLSLRNSIMQFPFSLQGIVRMQLDPINLTSQHLKLRILSLFPLIILKSAHLPNQIIIQEHTSHFRKLVKFYLINLKPPIHVDLQDSNMNLASLLL